MKWLFWVLPLMVFGQSGVEFNADFETGSLGSVNFSESDQTWHIRLADDNGDPMLPDSFHRYFHFACSAVAGRTLHLRFDNVYWQAGNIPLASYDGEHWFRVTGASDDRIDFEVPTSQDRVFFAYTFPYGVSQKNQWLNGLSDHPNVTIQTIGQAQVPSPLDPEIGNIEMLTLAKPGAEPQFRVWIHARIHPGEVPPSFVLEGFVDHYLNGQRPDMQWLREHCIIHIVPMVNPVGVYLGNYRTNAESTNLEPLWCAAPNPFDPHPIPELDALKSQVDAFQASNLPISLALNLHSSMEFPSQGHFHFKHLVPSVSPEFEAIEDRWIQRLDEYGPQFNDRNPASSQLSSCAFIESYFWNHYAESVMALTLETTYVTGDRNEKPLDPGDYRQLGQDMARGLVAYYRKENWVLPEGRVDPLLLFSQKYSAQVELFAGDGILSLEMPAFSSETFVLSSGAEQIQVQSDRLLLPFSLEQREKGVDHWMPSQNRTESLIVPHIALAPWVTEIVITNHLEHNTNLLLERSQRQEILQPGVPIRIVLDPSLGWERITSPGGAISGAVVYALAPQLATSIELRPAETQVLIPHIPADLSRWWLGLVWTNITSDPQIIELTGYDRLGKRTSTESLYLDPGEKKVQRFDLDYPDLASSAWIAAQSNQPIYGVFLFGTEPFSGLAGYPLTQSADPFLATPVVQGKAADWQGLTLLNPNEQTANVTAYLFEASGQWRSLDLVLAPGQTYVTTLSQMWGDLTSANWLQLQGDVPLCGLSLIGANDFSWIEGFPLLSSENLTPHALNKSWTPREK